MVTIPSESKENPCSAKISCPSLEMFATREEIAAAARTKDRDPCTYYNCWKCAGSRVELAEEGGKS